MLLTLLQTDELKNIIFRFCQNCVVLNQEDYEKYLKLLEILPFPFSELLLILNEKQTIEVKIKRENPLEKICIIAPYLTEFPYHFIKDNNKLKTFAITSSSMKELRYNFSFNKEINFMYLELPSLEYIYYRLFLNLHNLQCLTINNSPFIQNLPCWSWKNLTSLKELNLLNCNLTKFPICIRYFDNLQKLLLDNNLISKVPDWIKKKKNIQVLSMTNNKLKKFPFVLLEMENLSLLKLIGNLINPNESIIINLSQNRNKNGILCILADCMVHYLNQEQIKWYNFLNDKEDLFSNLPTDFCCPISRKIMIDPVINERNQTYERAYLNKWLLEHEKDPKDPMTNEQIKNPNIMLSNECLRKIIFQHLEVILETESLTMN